jgi:hypothetical protein
MSTNADYLQSQPGQTKWYVKLIISLIILFHLSAIITHVIAGGGPFVMKQISSWYRPYLKTMWMDNAYRFYAPDPGSTEVLWYKLQYEDGSTRWTQVPRREDFYLRMPFQRTMSIALLGSMMIEKEPVNPKDDSASVASVLVNNQMTYRTILNPQGEIYFRSYARHIGHKEHLHPATGSPLVSMDCYLVHYNIRTPYQMRTNINMYDPRILDIQFMATFSVDGTMSNFQQGFKEKMADDLFIELAQNEILPMLEANNKLPIEQRKSIAQILDEYGVPYPLKQPIVKLSAEDQAKFFEKPYDRDTLRERYAQALHRDDRSQNVINDQTKAEQDTRPVTPVTGAKTSDTAPRGIQ